MFGAGGQDALDGAVVRIPNGQGAGARHVQAGVTVFLPQSDDSLDGAQAVDGVDLGEFGDDRDRAGPDLLGLGATPRDAAQGVGDLVRWIVLDVGGSTRQMPHVGRNDDVGWKICTMSPAVRTIIFWPISRHGAE